MSSDFTDLLFEAEKLTASVEGTNDLPKVDRSLRQVLEASNELYSRVAQSGTKDIQANLLLGSKGIDLPKIAQKLDIISARRTFETVQAQEEVDIDTYLNNEIQNIILKTLEGNHKQFVQKLLDDSWNHQQAQWRQEKRKALSAMTAPSGAFIRFSKPAHLLYADSIRTVTTSMMGKQEAIFATKIDEYIRTLQEGKPKPNLIKVFAAAAEDLRDKKVNEMWEMMKYMSDLPVVPTTDDVIKSRTSKPVQTKLVSQAKRYLEDRYKMYMNNIVDENRSQAERGGIPGTLPLVRAFVGLRFFGEYSGLEDGLIDGRPFWPTVYYCLRCGDLNAAYHCLKKSNAVREELVTLLELRLRPRNAAGDTTTIASNDASKLVETIEYLYRCTVRNSTDPFKRIVWAVLGGCTGGDSNMSDEHSEVAQSVDDYLWLKLSLLSGGNVDGTLLSDKGEELYSELQRVVLEDCGETYYDAAKSPCTYFQVLVLTSQFEAALDFMARVERYKAHAIHMAIGLNELYLLAGPRDYNSPLVIIDPCDRRPARRLNIVRLMLWYVRSFETICIPEAVDYYYLLHNIYTFDNHNWYADCCSDLVVETREYDLFFGQMLPVGPPNIADRQPTSSTRTKGILDKYTHPRLTTQRIAAIVAAKLHRKGLFEDAIRVYDVSRNQEEALKLMITMLSQVVHLQKEYGSLRDRLEFLSEAMYNRYAAEGFKCPQKIVDSFTYLKKLLDFFNNYHSKQYNAALKWLMDLELIPFRSEHIEERLHKFETLEIDARTVFPDLLLASMNMLYFQYQSIKGNELIPSMLDNTIEKQLDDIREKAKVLTNFTGLLPYRMPGDTSSRMVQMEILMH